MFDNLNQIIELRETQIKLSKKINDKLFSVFYLKMKYRKNNFIDFSKRNDKHAVDLINTNVFLCVFLYILQKKFKNYHPNMIFQI